MPDQNFPQDMNQPTSEPQGSRALGTLLAEPATEAPQSPPKGLPPGTHPLDPSIPFGGDPGELGGTPLDVAEERFSRGRGKWKTANEDAFAVFQRAASDWAVGLVVPNSGTNGGVATVVGRQKGRVSVKLWVPVTLADGSTPLGVVLGPNESELQNPNNRDNIVLNVGDAITIETEGSVYVGVIPGNATGAVQYLVLSNPLGGPFVGD